MVEVVSSQGEVLSELVFNAQTGCLGANTVQVGCHAALKPGRCWWCVHASRCHALLNCHSNGYRTVINSQRIIQPCY